MSEWVGTNAIIEILEFSNLTWSIWQQIQTKTYTHTHKRTYIHKLTHKDESMTLVLWNLHKDIHLAVVSSVVLSDNRLCVSWTWTQPLLYSSTNNNMTIHTKQYIFILYYIQTYMYVSFLVSKPTPTDWVIRLSARPSVRYDYPLLHGALVLGK